MPAKGLDVDPKIIAEDLPRESLPETIVCLGCECARKHEEFQNRPNDPRCIHCVKTDAAKGREYDQEAMQRKLMAQVFDKSGTPITATMPRPSEVAGGLIEELGGLNAFVHAWADHVTTLGKNRPGSVAAVKAYHEIGKFILQASRQEDQRDIAEMTTDELLERRNASIRDALRELNIDDHRQAITVLLIQSLGGDAAQLLGEMTAPEREAVA